MAGTASLGTAEWGTIRGHNFSPACPTLIHRLIPSLCVLIVMLLRPLPALESHLTGVENSGAVSCDLVTVPALIEGAVPADGAVLAEGAVPADGAVQGGGVVSLVADIVEAISRTALAA